MAGTGRCEEWCYASPPAPSFALRAPSPREEKVWLLPRTPREGWGASFQNSHTSSLRAPCHRGFTVAAACQAGSKTPCPARVNMLRYATFSRLFEDFRAPAFDASYDLKRSSVNCRLVSSGVDLDATIWKHTRCVITTSVASSLKSRHLAPFE